MDEIKKVKAVDDIVFESAGMTIPKDTVYVVETVLDQGVVLDAIDGSRFMIDFETFEMGFEIVM